MLTGLV
jgi:hypothetical protein